MISKSYAFFGIVSTADEGTEVDVCEEAAVWTNVLLISPVLFIQCESLLPHIGSCVADCGPNMVDYSGICADLLDRSWQN